MAPGEGDAGDAGDVGDEGDGATRIDVAIGFPRDARRDLVIQGIDVILIELAFVPVAHSRGGDVVYSQTIGVTR